MRKGIYTYYKERLIEIGGNNKCLYLKSTARKVSYDIGHILERRSDKISDFEDFIWSKKKNSFTLICPSEKKELGERLEFKEREYVAPATKTKFTKEELEKQAKKIEKENRDLLSRAVELEITKLKEIKREAEAIEKETGRYELYVGYPFVFGYINQGFNRTQIKAPLCLIPVRIEIVGESTVNLEFNEDEKVRINPALVFAYAQSKKLNLDNLQLEFDNLNDFGKIERVVSYLREYGINIDIPSSTAVFGYSKFKEPAERELSIRHAIIVGRFSLSSSIYNDYSLLEKKKLTNDAIDELLMTDRKKKPVKKAKKRKSDQKDKPIPSYTVKMLDYAQSEVVKKVDEAGNMVIYGPPGTGKSQTIVNVISDAIAKNKRVLVVSQKKAALDVVYNRLGHLNAKAMYLNDEAKEKKEFYSKCLASHLATYTAKNVNVDTVMEKIDEIDAKIKEEQTSLDNICEALNKRRPFGLSLSEMYSASESISKSSQDYALYEKLCKSEEVLSLSYKELCDALFIVKANNLERIYYDFLLKKEKNPLIDHLRRDIDITTITAVKGQIEELQKSRRAFFNTAKYPYYRQIMAYYLELDKSDKVIDALVNEECRIRRPKGLFIGKKKAEIKEKMLATKNAIREYVKEYDFLIKVLTDDGYIAVIDNILRGNRAYVKLLCEALDNYLSNRDISKLVEDLSQESVAILNFAYSVGRTYQNYVDVIDKLLELRIYHELASYDEQYKNELAKIIDFENITSRIYKLKEEELSLSARLAEIKNIADYKTYYDASAENKDFLHQIMKTQNFLPVRKMTERYGEFIFKLFPCWLLSPENVSNLLPLTKNMFDIVIFDEASQVFIESTIPTIYRGKNIVVAGDSKQLRPSTTFMKRYLGADPETQDDPSLQAALEVESLLDLAVSRYRSANLTYHYRSRYSELIDFSNYAFYSASLQIAPNISGNGKTPPIERRKVDGRWIDRKNTAEATEIVEILKEIFKTRKNNESIGIITFNSDQQTCIADKIDKECIKDKEFRSNILLETHRVENGEDTGLFIKNLENVQGDERDIIIFSIGYAINNEGKLYTSFGSLSAEGGENRLNVAITRAKTKVIVVTSIEPEQLKVDGSKHLGPKLLKKYLTYARSVASSDGEMTKTILSELEHTEKADTSIISGAPSIEERMKERLERAGYKVALNLGNEKNRISLALYDEQLDRYLVGVILDKDAFISSDSSMERDVYKPKFLEARGWTIMRVWARDWWANPQKVVRSITAVAEKNRQNLLKA